MRATGVTLLWLAAVQAGLADMGVIPIIETNVQEPRQNAIILYDQGKKQETILLQTDLVADREVTGIFFMPLPADPKVDVAPAGVFPEAMRLTKAKGMTIRKEYRWEETLGADSGPGVAKNEGVQITLKKDLGEHHVTVARIDSPERFRTWVAQYAAANKIPMNFNLPAVEGVVTNYVKDGINHFLFDHVVMSKAQGSTKPLVIDFESERLYYPLRVNRLYGGPSDVQLMVLSPSRIPKGRFEKVGFFSTRQVTLTMGEVATIWRGLYDRSRADLNFQCFVLSDPRNLYVELRGEVADGLDAVRLRRMAEKRWERDVNLSLTWGEEADADYRLLQWPPMKAMGGRVRVEEGDAGGGDPAFCSDPKLIEKLPFSLILPEK